MQHFKRKIYDQILDWHNGGASTVLLLTGARQIGKSTQIQYLGRSEYESFIELNLYENLQAKKALDGVLDVQDLISRISMFATKPLKPGKTLIFIDEVQELPDLLTMAKFLVEDGRFRFVFSGSLLGNRLNEVRSYPVGYVTELNMYPMDFEEFLWATAVSAEAIEEVRSCAVARRPIPEYLHSAFLKYFRTYVVVGGMPSAINCLLEQKGDLAAVRELQTQLVKSYIHDITKYAGRRALAVEAIFNQLPLQLDKGTRRFVLNSIDDDARYKDFQKDFVWLTNAQVALKCDLVANPKAPLMATANPGNFKLYESDTGMLTCRYGSKFAAAIYTEDNSINAGAAFENVVAQQLVCMGLPIYYYMNSKRGEVDFLAETPLGDVVPLEVKSGSYVHSHKALDNLLNCKDYKMRLGIVLSRGNIEEDGKVLYLPWYTLYCLKDVLDREFETGAALPQISLPKI